MQRADRDVVLHGTESGRLLRLPHGEFVEVHEPISAEKAWTLTQHEQPSALELNSHDSHGVRRPGRLKNRILRRMSVATVEQVAKPDSEDLKAIEHH